MKDTNKIIFEHILSFLNSFRTVLNDSNISLTIKVVKYSKISVIVNIKDETPTSSFAKMEIMMSHLSRILEEMRHSILEYTTVAEISRNENELTINFRIKE